jgi:alkylation response protein AidB-like acyl-CoA dehydrogenase
MEPGTLGRFEKEPGMMAGGDVLSEAEGRRRPSLSELQVQLDETAAALESGLAQNDLTGFYSVLRATDLPLLAVQHANDPATLAQVGCKVLHRLGGASPAVALAFENHLYVSSAIATFQFEDKVFENRRQLLLQRLNKPGLLLANTNSRVHGGKVGAHGVFAQREGDGFRVRGSAAYMSLATQSDLMVFMAVLDGEGPALFVVPLHEDPAVQVGPFLFPRAMLDSDTRRVIFQDAFLPQEALLISRSEQMGALNLFEMGWHQLLIPALYLGAAARAIDEARLFLRSVRGPDDHPLAELDGMVIDIGRLVIRYRSAWALVLETAQRLGELAQGPIKAGPLAQFSDFASAAKYAGTLCAEDVVTAARRIVGARSFTGETLQPIERLSMEIPFGPMGPEVNALIERKVGRRALGEASVLVERL